MKTDEINHPHHYTFGNIEVIDMIRSATGYHFEGFLAGNVLKYVVRYRHKNGIQDLKKAEWYLKRLIGELEKGGEHDVHS